MWLARFCQLPYKLMGKSFAFRIFIKSAADQKNLKFGSVIAWTIGILQKNFHHHSNMPGGIQFFGPYFAKGLLSLNNVTGMALSLGLFPVFLCERLKGLGMRLASLCPNPGFLILSRWKKLIGHKGTRLDSLYRCLHHNIFMLLMLFHYLHSIYWYPLHQYDIGL